MPQHRTLGNAGGPIALIFGGIGPEHGVSCISARSILMALEELDYLVLCLGVTSQGEWVRVPNSRVRDYSIVGSSLPQVQKDPDNGALSVCLSLSTREPGFVIGSEFVTCSVAFPVIHGIGGEDGTIQGLLDSAGIAYVGSGVEASAISMNKVTSKRIAQSVGVEVGEWFSVDSVHSVDSVDSRELSQFTSALNAVGFPLFVKPTSGGSSAGITLVHKQSELPLALQSATEISTHLIVEKALQSPRELEVAILQTDSGVTASPVGEIRIRSDFEFYDFEAKYIADGAELITPAELDQNISEQIQSTAIKVFQAIGCRDYARVDFFLTEDNRIIFNEINTIPGFTSISMYSRMWESAGLKFDSLVNQLVANASARSINMFPAGS